MRGSRYAAYAALTVFAWCHYDARRHKRRRRRGNQAWRSPANRFTDRIGGKRRRKQGGHSKDVGPCSKIDRWRKVRSRIRELIDIREPSVLLSHFLLLALLLSAKLMRGRYPDYLGGYFSAASPEATVRVRSTAPRSFCGQDRWKPKGDIKDPHVLGFVCSFATRFWDISDLHFLNCLLLHF